MLLAAIFLALGADASASEPNDYSFEGPGRFCGYSAIIDLRQGETISNMEGGIHGASFAWSGAFGRFDIRANGWAAPPSSSVVMVRPDGVRELATRRSKGHYQTTLWNGRQGVVSFTTDRRPTAAQMAAMRRVSLFQEGEEPSECRYRMTFSWFSEE
jgi:hypothetical protein